MSVRGLGNPTLVAFFLDPVMSAKIFKIHPQNFFPEFETSIWIDGNMTIAGNLSQLPTFVDEGTTLACFDHAASAIDPGNCIYDEADKLLEQIEKGKRSTLDPSPIHQQRARLLAEGYPPQYGLISGNVLVRRHMQGACIDMMESWWTEILTGSRRDELSFNYLAWKTDFKFKYIPGDFKRNDMFLMHRHANPGL